MTLTLTLVALYLGLMLFGVGYNALISYAERTRALEGYTALAVVAGVMVTVLAAAVALWSVTLDGWQWGAILLGAFGASGLPMLLGSIGRYVALRQAEQRSLRTAGGDDER